MEFVNDDFIWNITAQAKEANIDIMGVIGNPDDIETESVNASNFVRDLRGLGRSVNRLNVTLHSIGGSIRDGMLIYSSLRDFPGVKVINIPAMAGSIATAIALSGDRINVGPESFWVVHNPRARADGEQKDMLHAADVLGKAKSSILDLYERKTGQDRDTLSDMMDAETWLQGEEIVKAGFADAVMADKPKLRLAAQLSPNMLARLRNTPAEILKPKPAPVSPEIAARLEKLRSFK